MLWHSYGNSNSAQHVNIDFVTSTPDFKVSSTKVKKVVVAAPTQTNNSVGTSAESASPQLPTLSLSQGDTHPYLGLLWKTLLNKKKNAHLHGEKQTYLVRLKITKSGSIESADVKGPNGSISKALQESLESFPKVPPIPDEISDNDVYVQYSVIL